MTHFWIHLDSECSFIQLCHFLFLEQYRRASNTLSLVAKKQFSLLLPNQQQFWCTCAKQCGFIPWIIQLPTLDYCASAGDSRTADNTTWNNPGISCWELHCPEDEQAVLCHSCWSEPRAEQYDHERRRRFSRLDGALRRWMVARAEIARLIERFHD